MTVAALPTDFIVESPVLEWATPVTFGGLQPTLSQLAAQAEQQHLAEQYVRHPLLLLKLALREQGMAGCSQEHAIQHFNRRALEGENMLPHLRDAITGQGDVGPMGWHAVLVTSGVPRAIAAYVMSWRQWMRL